MRNLLSTLGLGALISGVAAAQTVNVSSDITTSTTWTASNTYNLTQQIYVRNGATLTIEPGTVIASTATVNGSGSLAVTRGSMIVANGNERDPIIFTSSADVATWAPDASHPTGKDPDTGSLRAGCAEWGNLTIMGNGYISENATPGNTPTCNANNFAAMEGLVAQFPGDPDVLYGGGNDDDDSGVLSYCSFRYGGRVVGLANELNGLSLGGIGRETDIHHIEIVNNVDDGIEIWGGTVNLQYFSIWNIGDDSLDIDQGWRGKAQFGLIVQGYSCDADQGSGVGDNAIEMDGAEDSDYQPVTTASISNMTVIGQPLDGDGLTAWRDNARVQFRNSIFMDGGEQVVKFDNDDGDGASGYGHNGTLSWPATWTTAYNAVPAHANDCPAGTYTAQKSGNLAEITDSVFFRNLGSSAYTESDARGATDSASIGIGSQPNDNVIIPGNADADSPITTLVRGAAFTSAGQGKVILPVTFLDPRPQNEALEAASFDGDDEFFDAADYRGAFSPNNNWLGNWTASGAYGLTPSSQWTDLGGNCSGFSAPVLYGTGPVDGFGTATLGITKGPAGASGAVLLGLSRVEFPILGCTLGVLPFVDSPVFLDTNGEWSVSGLLGVPAGFSFYFQAVVIDPGAPEFGAFTNVMAATND